MAKNTVEVNIVGDADSAVKAFRQVDDAGAQTQSKFKSVASDFSTGAKVAFAGVGVASIGAVGMSLFQLGADLEQMKAKAKTVFGDQIGFVETWAKKSANAMGLTRNEATGLAANFADLLIPMGMSREQAAKMSTEVIGLSGALSAWSNGQKSAAEVADILQAAMLGETDSLKSLGISISAADIEARVLANGQAELTGKAREQAEALAVQQLIMEKSTDAQAAFNDGVQSTNEKVATQKARFNEAKEALANGFLPVVIWTTAKMASYAEATFNANEKTKGLQGTFFRFGEDLADFNAKLDETSGSWWSWVGRSKDALGGFVRNIFGMEGRAAGGPVSAGTPYVVGERGPELMVPGSSGTIMPAGSWGGGTVVNVSFNGVTTREAAEQVVQVLEAHLAGGGSIGNGRGAAVVVA